MSTWSLTSSAAMVSASPNTQLVKTRLAITSNSDAVSTAWAWPYTLNVLGEIGAIPYFAAPIESVCQVIFTAHALLTVHP